MMCPRQPFVVVFSIQCHNRVRASLQNVTNKRQFQKELDFFQNDLIIIENTLFILLSNEEVSVKQPPPLA